MTTSSALIGLGMPANLALELADTGAGGDATLALTATGNSFSTGAAILTDRRIVTVSNGNNTLAVSLPRVSATGVSIGDQYKIVNTGTDTVVVWASSGVLISAGGSNTSFALAGAGASLVVFPITSVNWGGWRG